MIIRNAQMETFREYSMQGYETRMLPHLRDLFPEAVEELGEEETREVIRAGVEMAAGYGIETEQDVGQFLTLMFLHSFEFDCDDSLPGAHQILTRPGLEPEQRLELLWRRTEQQLSSRSEVLTYA